MSTHVIHVNAPRPFPFFTSLLYYCECKRKVKMGKAWEYEVRVNRRTQLCCQLILLGHPRCLLFGDNCWCRLLQTRSTCAYDARWQILCVAGLVGAKKNSTKLQLNRRGVTSCANQEYAHILMLATVIPCCQHKQVAQNIHNQIRKPFRALSEVALHCVWLNFAFDMIQSLDTMPCDYVHCA